MYSKQIQGNPRKESFKNGSFIPKCVIMTLITDRITNYKCNETDVSCGIIPLSRIFVPLRGGEELNYKVGRFDESNRIKHLGVNYW